MYNLFTSSIYIYTSPSATMGGNTKIMLEVIYYMSDFLNITFFTTDPETFKKM